MGAWRDNDVLKVGETSGVTPGHWEASSLGTQVRTAPLPQDPYGNTGPGPWPEEHWAMAAGTSPLPHSLVITHPPLYSNCSCLISLWVLSLSLSVFVVVIVVVNCVNILGLGQLQILYWILGLYSWHIG